MRGARLECLVTAIGRNLVLLFLLAFVVVGAMIAVATTLPPVILTMIHLVTSAYVAVAHVTLFCNMMGIFLEPLLNRVAQLAFCAILDLALAFLCKGIIGHLQAVNILELYPDRLKCLIAKTSTALNVLCTILRVE
jgi:hypothetical protein